MAYEFIAKTFDFNCVEDITLQQLNEHYKLYDGYISKMNEIRSKLPDSNRQQANSTYSEYRGLKKAETFALDAIKLHELYFENLCDLGTPSQQFIQAISKSFGSMEKWLDDLKACGKASRGWVVTAFDPKDGAIHNFLQDAHDYGPIWFAYPLVVLDVYEHAYFLDFGTNKVKYIDVFIKNINWNVINARMAILISCYPEILK